jgi:hypothetical protein
MMNMRALVPLILLLSVPVSAQSPRPAARASANSPVGHWMAQHPARGGLGSWWDFRSDGTFTMHIGAMVTSTLTRSGNTVTMRSGTVGGKPVTATVRVVGDKLYMKAADSDETNMTRVGPAPSPGDPMLGKWRPNPPPLPADATPQAVAQQKAMAGGLVIFAADGTQTVRIPFVMREGSWRAAARTYQFKDEKVAYSFQLIGTELQLGQPPNNRTSETYIPDPVF